MAHTETESRTRTPAPALVAYALDVSGKDLAERVIRFKEMIARRDESFAQIGRQLFDLLLKPAGQLLDRKASWTIAPDSVLWQLPFQALQAADNRFVVESHAIAYAPSLTALHEQRKPAAKLKVNREPAGALLAFANPVISRQRAERIRLANADERLEQSAEAESEVKTLGQIYADAGRIHVGAQAREESAKQQAGNFKVLHFAAPAALNDLSPMYSHIAFADPYENWKDDGLLEAREILHLDLRAELAVLSASDTLEGRAEPGYGMMGMSWAFFVAGCRATILSRWRVESSSTTELMLELHKRLRSARAPLDWKPATSKAQALRQATLKLLENSEYKHPHHWSGFATIGDGS
jgi:CHAT domain-containing protein